ncbi:unnamed protein product [Gordionus sp. m RMFG-2023]
MSSESDSKENAKRKKSKSLSSNEEEPLAKLIKHKEDNDSHLVNWSPKKDNQPPSPSSTSDTSIEDDIPLGQHKIANINLKEKKLSEESKKSTKKSNLDRWKKYVRTAGIFVTNYNILFSDCKNEKQQIKKLKSMLQESFKKMKMDEGNVTLDQCKLLKKKKEEAKEIAELDLSNIIQTSGKRSKRQNVNSLYANVDSNLENFRKICSGEDNADKETFKRIQHLFDSEESSG